MNGYQACLEHLAHDLHDTTSKYVLSDLLEESNYNQQAEQVRKLAAAEEATGRCRYQIKELERYHNTKVRLPTKEAMSDLGYRNAGKYFLGTPYNMFYHRFAHLNRLDQRTIDKAQAVHSTLNEAYLDAYCWPEKVKLLENIQRLYSLRMSNVGVSEEGGIIHQLEELAILKRSDLKSVHVSDSTALTTVALNSVADASFSRLTFNTYTIDWNTWNQPAQQLEKLSIFRSGSLSVTQDHLEAICALAPNLRVLELGNVTVDDASIRTISNLTNLQVLAILSCNKVTDVTALQHCKYLDTLMISGSFNRPAVAEQLSEFKNLKEVYTHSNGLPTIDGVTMHEVPKWDWLGRHDDFNYDGILNSSLPIQEK